MEDFAAFNVIGRFNYIFDGTYFMAHVNKSTLYSPTSSFFFFNKKKAQQVLQWLYRAEIRQT